MATKSLLSKTSKSKKLKSQSKKVSKNIEYQFEVNDVLVYIGNLVEGLSGHECKVNSRSRTHYKVEFLNGECLECLPDVLKYLDEYELETMQLDNENQDKDNMEEMSDIELEMIKNGIESYKNYAQCLSPLEYYRRNCPECNYGKRCVYHKKVFIRN